MAGKYIKTLLIVGFLALIVWALLNNSKDPVNDDTPGVVEIGKTAPNFSAKLNDGSTFTLSKAEGKVVLVNIWATWCGPCRSELPAFDQLQSEYGDKLKIVAIDYAETKSVVDTFIKENGYKFAVAYDTDGKISDTKYPTSGIPYTVVVDKKGKVSAVFQGAPRDAYSTYKKAIEEAMR